jgi:hypothetical protein
MAHHFFNFLHTFSTKEEKWLLRFSKDNTQTHFKNLWNLKTFIEVQKNMNMYFLSLNKDSKYALKMWKSTI